MKQNLSVCLVFDFDAMSVWIGTFHARSPSAISRGEFGRIGAERLLEMLREWDIRSTWFIPGHTADAFPATVAKIAEAGHEIAHHDDFPAFEFVASRNGVITGLAAPSQIYEIWAGDFDYLHDRLGEGVYILTMHPQCIGRGHRLLMLECLVNHIRNSSGVTFKTMSEVAREFKIAHPRADSR